MNVADRILLSLDAYECWAVSEEVRAAMARAEGDVEPVLTGRGAASFGTVAGQQSIAELLDLMNIWAAKMSQLGQSYGSLSPAWVAKDPAAFTDWTNDWNTLQSRYASALSSANSAVTLSKLNVFTPNSLIPAQPQYDALLKALLACAPPDGCPYVKGDFDDLFKRLSAVAITLGAPAVTQNLPQPTATDVDGNLFAATAPVDVVAQVTGAQAATTGPLPVGLVKALQGAPNLGGPLGALSWLVNHKTAVLVGVVAVGGGIVLLELLPVLMIPAKAAKGIAALAA